jgi:hypothetical protein
MLTRLKFICLALEWRGLVEGFSSPRETFANPCGECQGSHRIERSLKTSNSGDLIGVTLRRSASVGTL